MTGWKIDGRDIFIQDWENGKEMSVEEAERRLNVAERLGAEIDVYVENANPKLSVVEIDRVVLENWVIELKGTDD